MTDTHKATIVHTPAVPLATDRAIHPLIASLRDGTLDPATIREMLTLQREHEASEAKKAYTRALAALKADLPTVIAKDATVDFTGQSGKRTHYTHATLAGALDAVTGPLTSHGFSLAWVPSTTERGGVRVTCRLTHREGHSEEATLDAPADTSGSKSPAQAIASTITLLQRYSALALLGIATRDMKEPAPEETRPAPASGVADARRILAAVGEIQKRGLDLTEIEGLIGRVAKTWTGADLDRAREWVREKQPKKAPPAAPRENDDGSLAEDPPG